MSSFVLAYNPVIVVVLDKHPLTQDECRIIPDKDTLRLMEGLKLRFLPNAGGFLIFQRSETVCYETFGPSGKTSAAGTLEPSAGTGPLVLRFLFIAKPTFTAETLWEGLGYPAAVNRYMEHAFGIAGGAATMTPPIPPDPGSLLPYLEKDYQSRQTASLRLEVTAFPPAKDKISITVNLNIKNPTP
ncbi:MAG: hypothetical protein WCK34_01585 [Bacteroidota bacterium]